MRSGKKRFKKVSENKKLIKIVCSVTFTFLGSRPENVFQKTDWTSKSLIFILNCFGCFKGKNNVALKTNNLFDILDVTKTKSLTKNGRTN